MPTEALTTPEHRTTQTPQSSFGASVEIPEVRASPRVWGDRSFRRWLAAWVGAPLLAIVNGAIREYTYKDQLADSTADRISVAPLIGLLAVYFWVLQRRWPLATTRDALSVGAIWAGLSVLFEFGFGHYVEGDAWSELVATYDVTEGNIWLLIVLWIALGPAIVRAATLRRSA